MTDQPTTRVRIRVLMNAEGKWAALGQDHFTGGDADEALYEMLDGEDLSRARLFWITAAIPTPQPVEIEASSVEEA